MATQTTDSFDGPMTKFEALPQDDVPDITDPTVQATLLKNKTRVGYAVELHPSAPDAPASQKEVAKAEKAAASTETTPVQP